MSEIGDTPRKQTHHYIVHYPAHEPRTDDPHYVDFNAYRRRTKDTAVCAFVVLTGDSSQCDGGLELHHTHIEFAVQNEVDLAMLEKQYPGVSNPAEVGAWVESAANLVWLCEWHHRGYGGIHNASAADYEAEHFIRGLIDRGSNGAGPHRA